MIIHITKAKGTETAAASACSMYALCCRTSKIAQVIIDSSIKSGMSCVGTRMDPEYCVMCCYLLRAMKVIGTSSK